MIRRPPRSTQSRSSAASDVYKRQGGGASDADGLVRQVFSKLLQVPVNSPEDNVFQLGGTSLTVARITSELRKVSPGLTLRQVYANPTVAGVADMIREDFDSQHLKSAEVTQVARLRHRIHRTCLLYTSPSPRDRTRSRMPSSA
eukprot:TRINITY_DN6901_c0_g1_i1.p2 TRINITY_DN6901_c0_g1~~TRINITY_DN6901_c0_g1_i1.p2  ORF type:complete len:144 (+),score=60.87 TRINITY_DN6901_c0_g1_i1:83-514(+)